MSPGAEYRGSFGTLRVYSEPTTYWLNDVQISREEGECLVERFVLERHRRRS